MCACVRACGSVCVDIVLAYNLLDKNLQIKFNQLTYQHCKLYETSRSTVRLGDCHIMYCTCNLISNSPHTVCTIDDVQAELAAIEMDLEEVEQQIASLLDRQSELNLRKKRLLKSLQSGESSDGPSGSSQSSRPQLSKQELQSYKNTGVLIILLMSFQCYIW